MGTIGASSPPATRASELTPGRGDHHQRRKPTRGQDARVPALGDLPRVKMTAAAVPGGKASREVPLVT